MTETINIPTKIRTYSNYCMFDTKSQISCKRANYDNPKVQKSKLKSFKFWRENGPKTNDVIREVK